MDIREFEVRGGYQGEVSVSCPRYPACRWEQEWNAPSLGDILDAVADHGVDVHDLGLEREGGTTGT